MKYIYLIPHIVRWHVFSYKSGWPSGWKETLMYAKGSLSDTQESVWVSMPLNASDEELYGGTRGA